MYLKRKLCHITFLNLFNDIIELAIYSFLLLIDNYLQKPKTNIVKFPAKQILTVQQSFGTEP